MQGFIPVDIPTKPYIKAYVINKLGSCPCMNKNYETITAKFYDVINHSTNERGKRFRGKMYNTSLRVYIPVNIFKKYGTNLNETNVKSFNRFIEKEIKYFYYQMMDDLLEHLPSFKNNLPEVRRKLGIDSEAWSEDSMKKEYYRKRKRLGQKLLNKIN